MGCNLNDISLDTIFLHHGIYRDLFLSIKAQQKTEPVINVGNYWGNMKMDYKDSKDND
jgi:hypothetical protein